MSLDFDILNFSTGITIKTYIVIQTFLIPCMYRDFITNHLFYFLEIFVHKHTSESFLLLKNMFKWEMMFVLNYTFQLILLRGLYI